MVSRREADRIARLLPASLMPRRLPWWHWASLTGGTRAWLRRRTEPALIGTLTGTVTWRLPDKVQVVELLYFDLLEGPWPRGRSFAWRSSGRYCVTEDPGGYTHSLYRAACNFQGGTGSLQTWREFCLHTQAEAMRHYTSMRNSGQ